MANIKEQIQNLLKNTTSAEVKSVCESFLKETEGKNVNPTDLIAESLFTNLKSYVDKDSQVGALINERQGYEKSIMEIESQISKNAAQRLSENWETVRRDKKVSNVGNHMDKTLKTENEAKAQQSGVLLEKLSTISDASAKKFVEKTKIDNYSIKESIETIKTSPIANHPNLKYIISRFETSLMENSPEHLLVNDFLSSINPFKWDKVVKEASDKVQESVNAKATELEVQNAIYAIKATDNKRFFTEIVSKMNEWVYSDKKNVHELVREMKGYSFNPHIKELTNRLMLMENSKGTQFNIPVKDSNCSVVKIFSPVHAASNGQVFKAGNNFYFATSDKFVKLKESQINALPKAYLELCESFFNPSVRVSDDMVTAYIGKTKIQITGDKKVYINERQIDANTLGSQLMFHTQQTIFRDSSNMANVVMNLYENMDKICEIDYGKAIMSNVFEGVGVYLFKKDGKVYINKVNPSMNENSFVKANALQTVNLVREFLSFNMSESLGDFLEGDHKKKAVMEGDLNSVINNIQILEGELDKIEKAILADPSYADVKEISDAKTLIENELNKLKSKWQEMSEELKKFETILDEKKEEDEEEEIEEIKDEEEKEEPAKEEKEEEEEKEPEAEDADGTEEGTEEVASSTETEVVSTPAASGAIETGLLGAEGTQAAATTIPGNDHLDANAGEASADSSAIIDAGFAGAQGTQDNMAAMQTSDAIKQEPAAQPVITPGGDGAQVIPGSVPNQIPVSADNTTPDAIAQDNTPVADDTSDITAPEGTEDAEIIDVKAEGGEKEEVKESVIVESIGIDSKVKDKVSGKTGTVTSINDEQFAVLLDDGETVERSLSELENVEDEIEQTISNNEKPVDVEANVSKAEAPNMENENEETNISGEEGKDAEVVSDETMFVKATLNIDLGPFKAGDEVEIDAANYTSSGEDEPVKLKEAKEGVTEVPKKYLSVIDSKPTEGTGTEENSDAKIAAVLQQLQDLETLLTDKNTKGSKAIEDAKEKIKKFAASLEKQEDKTGEEPGEEPGEEVK